MSKLERAGDGWIFYCPGCKEGHIFGSRWTFDGNMEAPTFSPSLKCGPYWRMPPGWYSDTAPKNADGSHQLGADGRLVGAVEWTCHLFLRAGMIEFLGDCTHELRGKTVPMEEV